MSLFAVTGVAGFIGNALAERLLDAGHAVVGIDSMTRYYSPELKQQRLDRLSGRRGWVFVQSDIVDHRNMEHVIHGVDVVVHLAAQPGVRYALDDPASYVRENVTALGGFLEALRRSTPKHLIAASSSSVYGSTCVAQSRETDPVGQPMSLYAATKIAGEAMLHSYSHLFQIPTTVLRPFTVYGPWGRPDMALSKFAERIAHGEQITLYDGGRPTRDFTYIDDVVESIVRLATVIPGAVTGIPGDTLSPIAPYRIVNVGGGHPETVSRMVELIEQGLGKTADVVSMPLSDGDVPATLADPSLLAALTGYQPSTRLHEGVPAFIDWFSSRA